MSIVTPCPTLAHDVVLYPHPRGVLVRLHRRRKTFLLGPTEARVLRLCDGSRDLGVLKAEAASVMNPRQVEKFLLLVESHGMLDTGEKLRAGRGSVIQFRLFSLPLANVFTGGWVCRFLARALYMALVPALVLIAWTVHRGGVQVIQQLLTTNFLTPSSAGVLVVSILVLGGCHEAAHGVTIAAHGGRVFEVGMLLNYFVPAFFVDVSGVELLPTRLDRIQVWMAGLVSQVCILSVSLFVQTHSQIPPWLVSVLVVSNAVNISLLIMNSLFFLKMDGYFITQELLDIRPLDRVGLIQLSGRDTHSTDPVETACAAVAAVFINGYLFVFLINLFVTVVDNVFQVSRDLLDVIMTGSICMAVVSAVLRWLARRHVINLPRFARRSVAVAQPIGERYARAV